MNNREGLCMTPSDTDEKPEKSLILWGIHLHGMPGPA